LCNLRSSSIGLLLRMNATILLLAWRNILITRELS
jgi:hypothetical protein